MPPHRTSDPHGSGRLRPIAGDGAAEMSSPKRPPGGHNQQLKRSADMRTPPLANPAEARTSFCIIQGP